MVVTGTTRGMGRAIAKHYAENGFMVLGCGRGESTLELPNYRHSRLDVGDEAQVRSWVNEIKQEFGKIDILICNAGSVQSALLMSVTPSEVLNTFLRTHVVGSFFVCREVSKLMLKNKYGRILTVSSLGVPMHLEGTAAYSASKSAVVEMTKILAKELASTGITCNVLSPALFKSEATLAFGSDWAESLIAKQTIKRYVTVEEICNVISFLISPLSGPITGQVINMGFVN